VTVTRKVLVGTPGTEGDVVGRGVRPWQDIRRPLGISHEYPVAEVVHALIFYAGSYAIIGGEARVAGSSSSCSSGHLSYGVAGDCRARPAGCPALSRPK
jgi:hypothetical protein